MNMLQLDNYFFPILRVEANPSYIDHDTTHNRAIINIAGDFNVSEDKKSCMAVLSITASKPDEEVQTPYEIEVSAFGSFSIPKGTPEEYLINRAPIFAFSILYTSAREMVLMMTSRGPWRPIMLPVHQFDSNDLSKSGDSSDPVKTRKSTKARVKK
jgi:preprotein translocase subunit SecB